jgi:hypothetical protein
MQRVSGSLLEAHETVLLVLGLSAEMAPRFETNAMSLDPS